MMMKLLWEHIFPIFLCLNGKPTDDDVDVGFYRKFDWKIYVDSCDFAAKFDDTGGYTMGV